MGERQKEVFAKGVLNTQRGRTQSEERIDVTVLVSDYAKIRSMARKTNHTLRTVLRDIVVAGVRNLAAEAIVLSIVCLALPSFGGWFTDEANEEPMTIIERQVGRLSQEKAKVYLSTAERRQHSLEDIASLSRIIGEKETEFVGKGNELRSQYGVNPAYNYSYSETNLTLYIVLTNGVAGSSPDNPVLRPHHAFASNDDAEDFLAIVKRRKGLLESLGVLHDIVEEKRRALAESEERLRSDFYLDPARKYRYDELTGNLFEVLPAMTSSQAKAFQRAKEEAERKAREMERMKAEEEAKALKERIAIEKRNKAEAEKKTRLEKEARERAERKAAEERAKAERLAREQAEKKARLEKEVRERAERKAAEERAKAEKMAREQAEAEAKAEKKAAEERAARERKAAEERAKAEKKAREQAEAKAKAERKAAEERAARERKAAEDRARAAKKAAEAKARAEAEARAKAEKERKAAERKAAKEAEEREKKRLQEERRIEEQSKRERKMREEAMKNIKEKRSFW